MPWIRPEVFINYLYSIPFNCLLSVFLSGQQQLAALIFPLQKTLQRFAAIAAHACHIGFHLNTKPSPYLQQSNEHAQSRTRLEFFGLEYAYLRLRYHKHKEKLL